MRFFISAGEESGEIYGARLMAEIKKIHPNAEFAGIGGDRMIAEGLDCYYHVRDMAVFGLVEILKGLFFYMKVISEMKWRIREEKYDAVIIIDAPELNFRLGKSAHSDGIPVFYYVSPQLWSWRTYRVNSVRKWVDTMIVIFSFEEDFYKEHNVNVKFVGHPMVDEIDPDMDREEIRKELMAFGSKKLVGVLPGSRNLEVAHMIETLIKTIDLIHAQRPDTAFVIPIAKNMSEQRIRDFAGGREFIKIIREHSHKVMAACDLLITKSGTSTLEGALFGTPMIIVYKTSSLSYWFIKLLAHVKFVGIPNLIAGKEVAPEFLQDRFKAETVAREAIDILSNAGKMAEKREEMDAVRKTFGEKGAPARAAKYILVRVGELKVEKGASHH